jgi:protein TonB
MSRIIRTTLQCLSIALGCAASAHAAPQGSTAKLDFNSCAKPQYPHADVQTGHEDMGKHGFLVDENGKVKNSKLIASSGFMPLEEAARSALRETRRPFAGQN